MRIGQDEFIAHFNRSNVAINVRDPEVVQAFRDAGVQESELRAIAGDDVIHGRHELTELYRALSRLDQSEHARGTSARLDTASHLYRTIDRRSQVSASGAPVSATGALPTSARTRSVGLAGSTTGARTAPPTPNATERAHIDEMRRNSPEYRAAYDRVMRSPLAAQHRAELQVLLAHTSVTGAEDVAR